MQTMEIMEKVWGKRPRSKILFYHGNASLDTARQTITYLETLGLEILAHPPYSPDLALYDFQLLPKIDEKFREKWFTDAKEVVTVHERVVESVPKYEWTKCPSVVP
ncbi:Mariner Mos1 transposase [Eumeta japonica]|uniref:Mariner Mos1 transposase n=1 Tax=Eumeta variegata TaxID=151549 RepID=A0A4C1TRZ4_EUMVA|nr:Mariner Mos1 transposase [Eumeta japonica]